MSMISLFALIGLILLILVLRKSVSWRTELHWVTLPIGALQHEQATRVAQFLKQHQIVARVELTKGSTLNKWVHTKHIMAEIKVLGEQLDKSQELAQGFLAQHKA